VSSYNFFIDATNAIKFVTIFFIHVSLDNFLGHIDRKVDKKKHIEKIIEFHLTTTLTKINDITSRDVKNIRTRGYPRIKPATGRKWILKMDTRYPWVRVFLIPAC